LSARGSRYVPRGELDEEAEAEAVAVEEAAPSLCFVLRRLSRKRAAAPSAQSEAAPKTSSAPATSQSPRVIARKRKGAERALAALMAFGSVAQESRDQPAEPQDVAAVVAVGQGVEEEEVEARSPPPPPPSSSPFRSSFSSLVPGSAAKPLQLAFHPRIEEAGKMPGEAPIRRGRVDADRPIAVADIAVVEAASHRPVRSSLAGPKSASEAPLP
jgi:hypothetical protein